VICWSPSLFSQYEQVALQQVTAQVMKMDTAAAAAAAAAK